MDPLTAPQLRVLGTLIEKEQTTPDGYPMTLAALLTGCNQATNRNPVTEFTPGEVSVTLDQLRGEGLSRVVHSPGQRADKYRQVMDEKLGMTRAELAVLAVLMLRGPQTINDLETRTERYDDLSDLGGVSGVLHRLKNRYESPYVTRLAPAAGHRAERWAHLLAGEVIDVPEPAAHPRAGGSATAERLSALEEEVVALRAQVGQLQSVVDQLSGLLE